MSDYGADTDPDMGKTYDLMVTKGFLPQDGSNVMQWTYDDGVVRKLASRQGATNILFKLED